ncbi:MAG: hypothetical protein R3Y35_02340 [Clostridia bacterium]
MILAIIGSRNLFPDISKYIKLLDTVDEIVSGGAKGVDSRARAYALAHNIKLTEFLPDYKKYGRPAPLIRNRLIVDNADEVLAFWDEKSTGTIYTIKYAVQTGKPVHLFVRTPTGYKIL